MAIRQKDYLYHHGIKGMKWGVRRTPEQLGHRVGEDRGEGHVKGLFKDTKPKKLPKGIVKPIVENPDYMPGENNSGVTDDEKREIHKTISKKAREIESGQDSKKLKALRAEMDAAYKEYQDEYAKLEAIENQLSDSGSERGRGLFSKRNRASDKSPLAASRERQERLSRNPAWAQAKKEVDAKKDVVKEKAGRYNDELAGSVLKSLGIEDSKEMRDFVCREGLLYDDD